MRQEKPYSHKLWWVITIIWAVWIRVIEWPTVNSISWRTFKWTKKLFFHLLDLAVLNSYILHSSCGCKKISHRDFRYTLVRNTSAHAGPKRRVPRPLDRPPNVESHVAMLEVCGSKHWPTRSEMQLGCRLCKARGVTKTFFLCKARGVTKKFSWSVVSVTWDCVWNKHVSKTTTPRYNCKNIWCDVPKKYLGLKVICN